jgi:ABC-type lipoprotein release transport system permease subunit
MILISEFNSQLFFYACGVLKRSLSKNIFIFIVMTLLVALLGTTLFLSHAIKYEYRTVLSHQPDIILSNQKAKHYAPFDTTALSKVLNVTGVSRAQERLYGRYTFSQADTSFYLVGIDEFESYSDPLLQFANRSLSHNTIVLSQDAKELLQKHYYEEYFNFIKRDGGVLQLYFADTIKEKDPLKRENLIILRSETFREIFDIADNEVTDLAVWVKNPHERAYVAQKLQQIFINADISVKEDKLVVYEKEFDLKSGFFLIIFIISFFTFFIIIYDKLSGISSQQRQEIGVLKALGWRVEDVLKAKLYECLILSLSAYGVGLLLAMIYVYVFGAKLFVAMFLQESDALHSLDIVFHFEYEIVILLFLLSVPLYIFATIIPSWRVAVSDADEVMR